MIVNATIENRLGVIDRLRGASLLGVVVVNAPFLLMSTAGADPALIETGADRAAALVTWVFFQAKAYLVFAFLFGYSLTLLLAAADRKGYSTGVVYGRRLVALLMLGTAHGLLLFPGDILVLYAVLGVGLAVLRHRPDRTLWRWLIGGYLGQVVLLGLLALDRDDLSGARTGLFGVDERLRTGGLVETTMLHAQLWPTYQGTMLALQGALVASMFCAGLLAGRHRLLQRVDEHRQVWRRIRTWGLVLGVPLQAWSGWLAFAPGAGQTSYFGGLLLQYLSAPLMSAGLVALIALLPARSPAALLEPDGRMSLTIYLGESVLLAWLGSGWGLGLLGLGAAPTLLLAVGCWVVLLGFAHAWQHLGLGRGPAERLLHRLTYVAAARRPTTP